MKAKLLLSFLCGILLTTVVGAILFFFTDTLTKPTSTDIPVVNANNTNTDVPANPLIGKRWYLLQVDNSPVDSKAYIEFMDDGSITGFDGCNELSSNYELTGTKLMVAPVISTLRLCDGTSEVDTNFATMLNEFTSAKIENNMLMLGNEPTYGFIDEVPVFETSEDTVKETTENNEITNKELVANEVVELMVGERAVFEANGMYVEVESISTSGVVTVEAYTIYTTDTYTMTLNDDMLDLGGDGGIGYKLELVSYDATTPDEATATFKFIVNE